MLNDFPKILQSLEEATYPIQDYLSVTTSKSQTEQVILARLPKPLATLYEKFNVFAKHYPQFNLSVKVKGLDADASDSHPEIDRVY